MNHHQLVVAASEPGDSLMSRVSTLFICVLLCLQTVCCGSTRRRENIPDTVAGEATRRQTWNHAESRFVKGNDAALCQISIKS